MPKRRERSETEWLKSQNKELKKENRLLKRRLKELERNEHMYKQLRLDEEPEDIIIAPEPVIKADCDDCGKGHMKQIVDLGIKKIYECTICGHRKTTNG